MAPPPHRVELLVAADIWLVKTPTSRDCFKFALLRHCDEFYVIKQTDELILYLAVDVTQVVMMQRRGEAIFLRK